MVHMPRWRNWQTHYVQVVARAISWEFKSPPRHMFPIIKGFLIGGLIAVPTGPVGFLCARRALLHHYRAALVSALGSIAADLIFGLIAIFSLTSVSHFFVREQNTIRVIGGLLLLYVGIKTFFNISHTVIPGLDKYEHINNFASTFLLTVTNPIQIITLPIVFAAIGTGVPEGDYPRALLFLVGLAAGSAACWIILIGLASAFRKHLNERHFGLINKVAGVLITGTGVYILATLIVR